MVDATKVGTTALEVHYPAAEPSGYMALFMYNKESRIGTIDP